MKIKPEKKLYDIKKSKQFRSEHIGWQMMGSEGKEIETYKPVLFGPFYYNFRTNSGRKTPRNTLTLKPWQFIPNVEVMG